MAGRWRMKNKTKTYETYFLFYSFVLIFSPPFPARFFLFRPNGIFIARHLWHLFVTGFVKNTLTTGHIYSHLELLSKRFSSRSCYKFRGGNDDRNGIYSTPIQVISDAILTAYSLRGALAKKKCARVSHEMTQFVLKIALLAIWMQPTPFLEKAQLRSLTPIMAPGINECSRSFGTSSSCKIVEALAKIKLLNHVLSLWEVVRDSVPTNIVWVYRKITCRVAWVAKRNPYMEYFCTRANQSNVGTQCLTSGGLNLRYGL